MGFGQKKISPALPLPIVPIMWSWWICRILVGFFYFCAFILGGGIPHTCWFLSPGLMYCKATFWMKGFLMLSCVLEALGASVQHASMPFDSHLFPLQLDSCLLQNSNFSILPEQNQNNMFIPTVFPLVFPRLCTPVKHNLLCLPSPSRKQTLPPFKW